MNALSLILYLAEVSDKIGWFTNFVTWMSALASLGLLIAAVGIMAQADEYEAKGLPWEKEELQYRSWGKSVFGVLFKVMLPIWVTAFLLTALIPSKNTIMLIAASQAGEAMLSSDPAKQLGGETLDTLKKLNAYIQQQIKVDPPAAPVSK